MAACLFTMNYFLDVSANLLLIFPSLVDFQYKGFSNFHKELKGRGKCCSVLHQGFYNQLCIVFKIYQVAELSEASSGLAHCHGS